MQIVEETNFHLLDNQTGRGHEFQLFKCLSKELMIEDLPREVLGKAFDLHTALIVEIRSNFEQRGLDRVGL
jgi:hypothetical protein